MAEFKYPPTGGGGGTGDVTGPASSTDNAVVRFNGATGKSVQNSNVTIDDSGNIATAGTVDGVDISAVFPASSTDNAFVRWSGVSGKVIKDSQLATLDGGGNAIFATTTSNQFIEDNVGAAATGVVRIRRAGTVSWRNAGNTADLPLGPSASDRLQFNSVDIPTISSTDTLTNKTIAAGSNTITGLANANIDAAAAISGTKISPAFGAQNISTTGTLSTGAATLGPANATGTSPTIHVMRADGPSLAQITASTAATSYAVLEMYKGATRHGRIGASGTGAGALVTGVSDGDVCIVSNSTNIRFSADNGTTTHGLISSAGAWTLGPTSGSLTHTFQSGGQTLVSAETAANNQVLFQLKRTVNTAQTWQMYIPVGSTDLKFFSGNNSTDVGWVSTAGAWTLGATNAAVSHIAQGTLTSGYIFKVANNSTSTTPDASSAFVISKGSTSNGAGVNAFITFQINAGGTNSGYIGTNGANAAAFFNTSDRRAKQNITTLDGGLEKVLALRPVQFDWKSDGSQGVSYIAQEVAEVLPHLVTQTDSGEGENLAEGQRPWSMTETGITPYLVRAIQEQQALIVALQARIEALETN